MGEEMGYWREPGAGAEGALSRLQLWRVQWPLSRSFWLGRWGVPAWEVI